LWREYKEFVSEGRPSVMLCSFSQECEKEYGKRGLQEIQGGFKKGASKL
jgi:hypothetical protein